MAQNFQNLIVIICVKRSPSNIYGAGEHSTGRLNAAAREEPVRFFGLQLQQHMVDIDALAPLAAVTNEFVELVEKNLG